ncbi:MAG: hypothetical protein H6905_05790 [Hyphomicrobiales bacterium]|nr:hypothetical protein [Hyphomicrobiales bacterium]
MPSLRYSKPSLSNPTTLVAPLGGKTFSGLDRSKDYIIDLSNTAPHTGDIVVFGGNDIVIIGGELRNAKFQFADQTGTVYIEGVKIQHTTGQHEGDGISFSGDKKLTSAPDLIVQNTQITGIEGNFAVASEHGDIIQAEPWIGLVGDVKIHNFYGSSGLTGLSLRSDAGHAQKTGDVYISETRLDHVNGYAQPLYHFYDANQDSVGNSTSSKRQYFLGENVWAGSNPYGDDSLTIKTAIHPNETQRQFPEWYDDISVDRAAGTINFAAKMGISGTLHIETQSVTGPSPDKFGAGAGLNYTSSQSNTSAGSTSGGGSSSSSGGSTGGNDGSGSTSDGAGVPSGNTILGDPNSNDYHITSTAEAEVMLVAPDRGRDKWANYQDNFDKLALGGDLSFDDLGFTYDSAYNYTWLTDKTGGNEKMVGLKNVRPNDIDQSDFVGLPSGSNTSSTNNTSGSSDTTSSGASPSSGGSATPSGDIILGDPNSNDYHITSTAEAEVMLVAPDRGRDKWANYQDNFDKLALGGGLSFNDLGITYDSVYKYTWLTDKTGGNERMVGLKNVQPSDIDQSDFVADPTDGSDLMLL